MPALIDAALDAMDYAVDRNDQDHWTRFLDEWGVRAEDMELILALHKAYSRGFRCAKRTMAPKIIASTGEDYFEDAPEAFTAMTEELFSAEGC